MKRNFLITLIANPFFVIALIFIAGSANAQKKSAITIAPIETKGEPSRFGTSPVLNEVRGLVHTLGKIDQSGSQVEVGVDFILIDTLGMNGNSLFYDLDYNGSMGKREKVYPMDTIFDFDPTRLSVLFSGEGSTELTFNYSYLGIESSINENSLSYNVSWTIPVPIELIHFSAKSVLNEVTLTWEMATETNNLGFIVLRSVDKGKSYERLGFTEGVGTSSTLNEYIFIDKKANLKNMSQLCYRLIQVDIDGRSEISDLVCLESNDSGRNIGLDVADVNSALSSENTSNSKGRFIKDKPLKQMIGIALTSIVWSLDFEVFGRWDTFR